MSGQQRTGHGATVACDGDGSDVVLVSCSECSLTKEVPDVESALDLQDRHAAAAGINHVLEFECDAGAADD